MTEINRTMTLGSEATPFGCCNFFDGCADGIFSLYYRGRLGLLDWLGFNVSDDCYRVAEFISYVRPEQSGGRDTHGYISDPCADPNGIEFGSCKLSVEDFGLYGREGPVRNLFKPMRYCKTRPRYFLDGTPVTSEGQWDMFFTMDALLNDVREAVVIGNSATAGQFDGLQQWVKTGYDCSSLDSYVVDWNGNGMDGTGGGAITINGAAIVGGPYTLVDFLLDLYRNIRERVSWSPMLNSQNWRVGDTIIAAPGFILRCLLDSYACWSVCPGAQYAEVVKNAKEIREFRDQLNGGMFGDGKIYLDGFEIPLMNYAWGMINGPTTGDMYMLTGSIGAQRIWEGEHISANNVMSNLAGLGFDNSAGDYISMDDGRVLMKGDFENLCSQKKLWMAPRLWCFAPWAQVRFQDVVCRTPSGPLSPNPADTSYFPLNSFSAAECP